MSDDFAVFILSHGRPNGVRTFQTLKRLGYTGRIVIVVDDMDTTVEDYRALYGEQVVVFDKREAAAKTDACDNLDEMRAVVFARNAAYDIARDLGLRYFLVLDDDYSVFKFRFNDRFEWTTRDIHMRDLDRIFAAFVEFLRSTPTYTIAMAQGGDFIGGHKSNYGSKIMLSRKAMNSFFCDVDRPIEFMGRINEDVNAYTRHASVGRLFFTHSQVAVDQAQTQQQSSGLTDIYLRLGTYVKSFYTVLVHPSGATVRVLQSRANPRIHHRVDWSKTAPKILRENLRKPRPNAAG